MFQKGLNRASLNYVAGDEVTKVLREVYACNYAEHQRRPEALRYWTTMEGGATSFARRC